MAVFMLEMGEAEYRITCDGEEGLEVPYGEVATLKVGDAVYYAHVEDPDAETAQVYRVDAVSEMPTELDDVDFGGGDEGEPEVLVDGDGEPEDEEDDEEGEDGEDEEDADDEPGSGSPVVDE